MNHPWLPLRIFIFVLLYGLTNGAFAQTPSSATSIGNAGSGRASVEAGDIQDLNPAMLVHLKGRDLHSALTGEGMTVGITDNSKEVMLPGALAYQTSTTNKNSISTRAEDLKLSLAEFVSKQWSFGITGHQMSFQRDPATYHQNNVDMGVTWIATPKLGLAVVGYDLMSPNVQVPLDLRTTTRTGFGLTYLFRDFVRFKADVVSSSNNNFQPASTLLGYEASLNQFLLIRFGYGTEPEYSRESLAAGVGLNLPRFRINYGYMATIHGDGDNRHSVDLGIPF